MQGRQGIQGINGLQGIQGINGLQGIQGNNNGGFSVLDDTTTDATRYIVFDDATSGIVTQANVSSSKLQFNPFTGTLTAIELNSTSDIELKENILTIENALEVISNIRGVSFDWRNTGKKSYGVIAQEIEAILPELVNSSVENKSVNYNGLLGFLIEAIKQLSEQVQELNLKINS